MYYFTPTAAAYLHLTHGEASKLDLELLSPVLVSEDFFAHRPVKFAGGLRVNFESSYNPTTRHGRARLVEAFSDCVARAGMLERVLEMEFELYSPTRHK